MTVPKVFGQEPSQGADLRMLSRAESCTFLAIDRQELEVKPSATAASPAAILQDWLKRLERR
eukprot:CAMPEP_0197674178 /NCGR_PEP_ID=MMETSP1338-20131121/82415_1 /TAXON_ID=43686 ORGANISM="Pelagodinium beii, Strain RCC1491" /NCGR_SAMPLE_ID=MMETSP1338 /ASSEMBLY_ACC=CAM_ASM_000754 /LENGTH=61 /DNA_ID=CAMNT_0043254533 /DNA_START=1116 /DNA_END=1302 /DNA_ORIENTATION=-